MENKNEERNVVDMYDFLDQITEEFFQKEAAILSEHHFSDYVFAIIKRNNEKKFGKVIRVYPKKEFDEMKNQEWFLACDFSQMMDWMAEDKESKTDMYIMGEALQLYIRNPSFRDYIQTRGIEQYFENGLNTSYKNAEEINNLFFSGENGEITD